MLGRSLLKSALAASTQKNILSLTACASRKRALAKMKLEAQIIKLRSMPVSRIVNCRLKEFSSFKNKPGEDWWSELCFCILTANSKAVTAIRVQNDLGYIGFLGMCRADLASSIKERKHRFHNNKARFIENARAHLDIKKKLIALVDSEGEREAREWLVKNIQGIGYKEASHFLRNVGYSNVAILDRHIINLMFEHRMLREKPKSLSKKNYLALEKKFQKLALEVGMSSAELDLYMWYMKTGEVLK